MHNNITNTRISAVRKDAFVHVQARLSVSFYRVNDARFASRVSGQYTTLRLDGANHVDLERKTDDLY
jgi:hypothetical protein